MSRLAQNPYVTQLQNRLRACGIKVKPDKLERVLELVRWDVDLAQTAFLMRPQPAWLMELLKRG